MLKRVISLLLCGVIALSTYACLEGKKVNALTVVPSDDNNHYYVGNNIDNLTFSQDELLTVDNYTNYFNSVSGDLKDDIYNKFYGETSNVGNNTINSFISDYQAEQGYVNFSNTYFKPIVIDGVTIPIEDCKKIIQLRNYRSVGYNLTLYLFYNPNGDNIYLIGSDIYCISDCYYTQVDFTPHDFVYDNTHYDEYTPRSDGQYQLIFDSNNSWYHRDMDSQEFVNTIYSDLPYYFVGFQDYSSYTPYFIANVLFGKTSDNSGFIIDRRTDKFIDKIDQGGSVTPSQYGFKTGSFHNAVYGSTFNDQKLFVAYELNDSSKSIKNDLYLKLDYIFDMDGIFVNNEFDYSAQFSNINGSYDLYSLSDSNYINVSLDSVFDKMNVLYRDNRTLVEQYRNIYNYFNPAADGWVASPSQVNPNDAFGILYKNGLLSISPVSINYSEQFLNSLSVNYKEISFGIGINANAISNEAGNLPRINRLDSCYITIIESVYNVVTGEESNVFMYTYNYITKEVQEVGTLENGNEVFNGYSNGSQSSLNNPNSDNMNYNTSSGQYLPNAYGGSSSASVGDIIINSGVGSIPYILVDIPENEWMNKTPNLNTFLTEFKTMLAETHEQSVLNMLPATYNYFPAPVMQYLIYGVGLIVMIGIWRAITRR